MVKLIEKAEILTEALPYIKQFSGKTIVIKYGGSAMIEERLKDMVSLDIILMKYVGINPIIVHGGGKAISELMSRLGKDTIFLDGYRVTDQETMNITEMVLAGLVNKEIVSRIQNHGGNAVGISGKDSRLIVAQKKIHKADTDKDLGFTGEVVEVHSRILEVLEKEGFIPVVSPVAYGEGGFSYNVNADEAAAAIAMELKAEKLIFMTDVPGIMRDINDENSLITHLDIKDIDKLYREKIITKGMMPKVEAAARAIHQGVKKVHIIDGRIPHSILLEILTSGGIGTELVTSA
jgi:acetylglutamate kinase